MIKLLVLGDYSSSFGSFKAGQVLELDDNVAEFLLRDSPGSFINDAEEKEPDADAFSAETATGLTAPDRRARGGGIR